MLCTTAVMVVVFFHEVIILKKFLAILISLCLCAVFVCGVAEEIVSGTHTENVEVVTPTPAPTPRPDWAVSVRSNLSGKTQVMVGTEVVLTAVLENFRDEDVYTIEWQENRGDGWVTVGDNSTTYKFKIDTTNVHYSWRVVVHIQV